MKESKHTPRKWIVDETTGINSAPVYLIESIDGDSIANTRNKTVAQLIASAPELLSALKAMLQATSKIESHRLQELGQAENQARTVLASVESGVGKDEPENTCANFNTDLTLWQNKRQSLLACPNHGALLNVKDGHICDGLQVLARFQNDAKAKATLRLAGFEETTRGFKAVPR